MLQPKKTKFRKAQKGRIHGVATRGNTLCFGHYGLVACEPARVSSQQIEATRVALNRHIRNYGSLWVRIFPNVPVTRKAAQVRMGQGKGAVDRWICRIRPQRVLFEISQSIPEAIAKKALRSASHKLPITTKIICKN